MPGQLTLTHGSTYRVKLGFETATEEKVLLGAPFPLIKLLSPRLSLVMVPQKAFSKEHTVDVIWEPMVPALPIAGRH